MGEHNWRDVVDEDALPDGAPEFLDELARSGWYVRSMWGDYSLRLWPDGGRSKQITIDLRYPMIEPRREAIRDRIKSHVQSKEREGGTR